MLAHLYYPTRQFMILLSLLTVSSLPVLGTGCSSSEPTEYRQFSETIDEHSQKTDQESKQTAATPPTITNQAIAPEEKLTEPEQIANHASPVPTENTTNQVTTKPGPAMQAPAMQAEEKAQVETATLVARKPDPKDRALTDQEKKALAASEPREVKILVKERSFRKTKPENALLINYDDIDLLKVMNMEPVTLKAPELMPQWLKDLDGKRIQIRGFMYPPFQQTGNEFFQLARDNQICCFGKNPKIYDLFPVVMRDGVTADYILNRPFDVVGVFHIKAETIDGELERIYLIDDAIVVDK
ncbi:hypothetical protein [uncultured Gimesia sp.]|uniref:hypothetical protein n=1 Tax=uncultured Gimesia sp. TaxID=1678688 RepID=UPI0030D8AE17